MNRKVIILLFSGVLMGALDIAVIGPALPAIQQHFQISSRNLPWIFNIYVLFNLIATPLMGKLSDLYGRRIIYVLDVFLFGAGSLLIMSSMNFSMLLAGRAIQGFGAGGIFPVAASVIGDTVPKEKQGSALGWIGAVFGFAFIIGPPVGGALLLIGWKWIFAINIPFALLVGFFSLKFLPGHKKTEKIQFDFTGMFLLILSLFGLAFGINRIDSADFAGSLKQIQVWLPLLTAFILLPVFYFLQLRNPYPTLHVKLMRSRQLLISYFIAFGAGIGELSSIYLPSLAHQAFGVSNSTASFMLMPLVFTLFIFAPLAGKMIDRSEVKYVIVAGILLLAAGLGIMALYPVSRILFYTSGALIGAGLSFLLGAPLRYIMNRETSESDRASGQSILTLFTSTGQLVSAALAGALIQSLGNDIPAFQTTFGILALLTIPLVVASMGLHKYNIKE